MVIGELVFIDSEFLIEIQDINFLSTSNANIQTPTSDSTSFLYTWTTATPTGRLSVQAMANNTSSANPNNTQELDSNNEDLIENTQESNVNEDLDDALPITQPRGRKRGRK